MQKQSIYTRWFDTPLDKRPPTFGEAWAIYNAANPPKPATPARPPPAITSGKPMTWSEYFSGKGQA